MIKIAEMLGGSHAYGLNTPSSDRDIRGVFLDGSVKNMVGLGKVEHKIIQDKDQNKEKKDKQDEHWYELRHYLSMLRKSNTQCLELLFNMKWVSLDPRFTKLQNNWQRLVTSWGFYNSIKGYAHGEIMHAFGEKTGPLGAARKHDLETYGYSPRNIVHVMRLCFCAMWFFKNNEYPVNIFDASPEFHKELMCVKTQPEAFNAKDLRYLVSMVHKSIDDAFADRAVTHSFDEEFANEICLEFYAPIVQEQYNQLCLSKSLC